MGRRGQHVHETLNSIASLLFMKRFWELCVWGFLVICFLFFFFFFKFKFCFGMSSIIIPTSPLTLSLCWNAHSSSSILINNKSFQMQHNKEETLIYIYIDTLSHTHIPCMIWYDMIGICDFVILSHHHYHAPALHCSTSS